MSARQFIIEARQLNVVVRPLGGLGWTWSYHLDGGPEVTNSGRLEPTEDHAFAAAHTAACRTIQALGSLTNLPVHPPGETGQRAPQVGNASEH